MNAVLIVASKEIREGLRNRWVLATTLLLAALGADAHLSRQRADRERSAFARSTW